MWLLQIPIFCCILIREGKKTASPGRRICLIDSIYSSLGITFARRVRTRQILGKVCYAGAAPAAAPDAKQFFLRMRADGSARVRKRHCVRHTRSMPRVEKDTQMHARVVDQKRYSPGRNLTARRAWCVYLLLFLLSTMSYIREDDCNGRLSLLTLPFLLDSRIKNVSQYV